MYLDLFYELSTFISNCEFRIPLEVKELGENIIILKVLLHIIQNVYMVEKRTQVVRLVLYMSTGSVIDSDSASCFDMTVLTL